MPTLLYAEDESEHRVMLRDILKNTNVTLIEAANGQEAIQKIAAHSPDLILLDLFMPQLDGFGVMKAVKANPESKDIPIIVISAWPTGDNRARAKSIGAAEFIEKPYDPFELVELVNAYLPTMSTIIQVTDYLQVEMIPSGQAGEPLLTIRTTDAQDQAVTIYLEEVGRLITTLSQAAERMAAMKMETRRGKDRTKDLTM